MMPAMPATNDPPPPSSLWRELADGSAGRGLRVVVTVALTMLLTGLVPILAYLLAALNPGWNRANGGIFPEDALIGFLIAVAAAVFLTAMVWLWATPPRRNLLWRPTAQTLGIAVAAVCIGIMADANLPGESEMVALGIVPVALSVAILVWVQAWRQHGLLGRPVRDARDGYVDLRCPSCGYRMVGLTESRCPECGAVYTLDELLLKQGFAPQRAAYNVPPPPPVRALPGRPGGQLAAGSPCRGEVR